MIAGINLEEPTARWAFFVWGLLKDGMSVAAINAVGAGGGAPAVRRAGGPAGARWCLYAGLIALLSVVSDGWSGKPSPFVHQLLLLPATAIFFLSLYQILRPRQLASGYGSGGLLSLVSWPIFPLVVFEAWSLLLEIAEARHFRSFGYHLTGMSCVLFVVSVGLVWRLFAQTRSSTTLMAAVIVTYATGLIVAIRCFPLNYMRSDMLPVIGWADGRLLRHLNPYGTMQVGTRLYDFPYLPGMLVAFLPAAWLHADLRWATLSYLVGAGLLVYLTARRTRRFEVAGLLGCFLLCPFLQYRHDLYLEPHWFALALAVVLMQRRRFVWSAVVWGMSCAVYQLSWVIVPFVLLNAFRRRGVIESTKLLGAVLGGALVIGGPFLRSAFGRIASNTVGQWSRLPHAVADPINVSYWMTFLIRPDQLKWVQAGALVALFGICIAREYCRTLTDTLRWMCCSLAIFIPLNVIVDGYFYLTLALMLLFFVCAAEGYWDQGPEAGEAEALFGPGKVPETLARA